jgi:nicotinamide-nucleotide adenylyltransferase
MSARASSSSQYDAAISRASVDGFASFELLYASTPTWPYSPASSTSSASATAVSDQPVHLAVLDSSYNPPHLAHHYIATSGFPPPHSDSSSIPSKPYTARLLLFSPKNVDKVLKAGDSSVKQRVEMMVLLARRMAEESGEGEQGGVAVGLVNEATFVGKSRNLHRWLRQTPLPSSLTRSLTEFEANGDSATPEMLSTKPPVTLTFLIGTDTLTRFFAPRYYPAGEYVSSLAKYFSQPPHGEGSNLVTARRGASQEQRDIENEVLKGEEARPWVDSGSVRMLDAREDGLQDVASTDIRRAVGRYLEQSQSAEGVTESIEEVLKDLTIPSIARYIHEEGLYR